MDSCCSPEGIPHSVPPTPTCVAGTPRAVVLCTGVPGLSASPPGGGLQDAPDGSSGTRGPARSGILQFVVSRREGDGGWRLVINLSAINGDGRICSGVDSPGELDVLH